MHLPIHLLALNWLLAFPHAETHRFCAVRDLVRVANHQAFNGDEWGKARDRAVAILVHH